MSKVRCNNCMKMFEEDKIIYDGEEDTEYCPYCGEGGCLMDLEDDDKNICPVCHHEIEYDFNKYEQYGVVDGGYVPWNCKNCGSKGTSDYKLIFDHHDINENGIDRIYDISKELIDGLETEYDVKYVVAALSKMMKEKGMSLDEIEEMCLEDSDEAFAYISNTKL